MDIYFNKKENENCQITLKLIKKQLTNLKR